MSATFEQVWAKTGRIYGKDELESVRLGWELHECAAKAEAAKHLDKRYAQGYSDGWREGREDMKKPLSVRPDFSFKPIPYGDVIAAEAKAVAPLSEEVFKEQLRSVIRLALSVGHGRGENGDSLAGTKDFIEKMVKTCTEILTTNPGERSC